MTSLESEESIVNFLKANVNQSSSVNIENELKKEFVLAKVRSKKMKKKQHKKKKLGTLTRKEKKQLGFYAIPRDSVNYEDVLPLNEIWVDYMSQILELEKPIPNHLNKRWENFTQTVYKADFHGSDITVIRSKCPSYVGKNGICIMDTRNTFKIVSKDNVVTTIPKRDCVFEINIKHVKVSLFGKHLCVRPAERSTKKIKSHLHPDL